MVLRNQKGWYKELLTSGGKLTKAGEVYERLSGETLDRKGGIDLSQTTIRKDDTEIIRVGGKAKVVRKYDPATNVFKYNRLGLNFFQRKSN